MTIKKLTDVTTIGQLKTTAESMKAADSDRDALYDALEDIYFLESTDMPDDEGVKTTISPTGKNAVDGMKRLLAASEPIITVKRQDAQDTSVSGKIEAMLQAAWRESCKAANVELQSDAALAAILYSRVDIAIILTSELVKLMKGSKSKAAQRRVEKLAAKTPLMFKVLNPRNGYFQQDDLGMSAYYRREETTIANIKNVYGLAAENLKGADTDPVYINDYWDLTYHLTWVDELPDPLEAVEHDLPFIPVVVAVSEGSRLWTESDRRVDPFLAGLHKSGLHKRESLTLTTIYTKLAQSGSAAPVIIERGSTDGNIEMDASGPFPIWYTNPGDKVVQSNAGAIDPNVYRALEIAGQKSEQTTIYTQALGAPLGASSPFSAVALLGQAGRLPLTTQQKAVSKAIGDAMQTGVEWLAEESAKHELLADVDMSQAYTVEAKVDVKLPQDMVKNAGVAGQIVGQGLASTTWAQENLMQITDPDAERRKMLQEKVYMAMFQKRLQEVMAMPSGLQQPGQPGQPGQQLPPGQQPPQQPGPMPPGQGQPMPPEAMTQPGMPGPDGAMQEPLPPELAAAMGGGQQPGGAPNAPIR